MTIVRDSYPDDTYRVSGYTEWLTANTPIWAWGAFDYPDMTIFAPLGTLGERRDLVATQIRAEIEKGN
jgi:hypothetical protein